MISLFVKKPDRPTRPPSARRNAAQSSEQFSQQPAAPLGEKPRQTSAPNPSSRRAIRPRSRNGAARGLRLRDVSRAVSLHAHGRAMALLACDIGTAVVPLAALKALGADPLLLGRGPFWTVFGHLGALLFVGLPVLPIAALGGYSDRAALRPTPAIFARLCVAAALTSWCIALLSGTLASPIALRELAVAFLAMPPLWWLSRRCIGRLLTIAPENVLVVGSGVIAERAIARVRSTNHHIVGWVDDDDPRTAHIEPRLGGIADLPALLARYDIQRVLVAFSATSDEVLARVLRECDAHDVEIDIVSRLFDCLGMDTRVHIVGGLPVLRVQPQQSGWMARAAKRGTDCVLAAIMLVLLAPVMIAVALAIVLDDGRPVMYRQRRIGRGGREFDIWKFRTMVRDADQQALRRIAGWGGDGFSVADAVAALKEDADPRQTGVGAFLRRSSLDELPQLYNVIRGDMSLVGPRPLRAFEVDRLHAWQLVRQNVRPGMTGLWQVLGRSGIPWDERMQLDYTYVRHWRPVTDLRILALTVPAVLGRRGAR